MCMEVRWLKTDLTVDWSEWHQQHPVVSNLVVPCHWRIHVDLYESKVWADEYHVLLFTPHYTTCARTITQLQGKKRVSLPWCETCIKCVDIRVLHNHQYPIVREPLLSYRVRRAYPYPDVRLASSIGIFMHWSRNTYLDELYSYLVVTWSKKTELLNFCFSNGYNAPFEGFA
jgi:hypothetical protein